MFFISVKNHHPSVRRLIGTIIVFVIQEHLSKNVSKINLHLRWRKEFVVTYASIETDADDSYEEHPGGPFHKGCQEGNRLQRRS